MSIMSNMLQAAGGAGPAAGSGYNDTFTAADGTSIGSHTSESGHTYTRYNWTLSADLEIYGNALRATATTSVPIAQIDGFALTVGVPFNTDVFVEYQSFPGIFFHMSNPGPSATCLWAYVYQTGGGRNDFYVGKLVNGVYTTLYQDVGYDYGNPDELTITVKKLANGTYDVYDNLRFLYNADPVSAGVGSGTGVGIGVGGYFSINAGKIYAAYEG